MHWPPAGWLYEQGVREGDRIAVLSQDGVSLLDLLFACSRLGAILVPWNWRLNPRELRDLVGDTKPSMLFVSVEFEELARTIAPGISIVAFDGSDSVLSEILACAAVLPDYLGRMSDPWLILYTGGTTGTPKGAVLTRGSITWNSINTVVSWGLSPGDYWPCIHALVSHRLLERFHSSTALRRRAHSHGRAV